MIWGYGRFGFDVGSGVMLVGLKKRRRLGFNLVYNVEWMPGEAEAVFIYLAKFSITNKRFKNADTLYFLGRHGKLARWHLRWCR
jgi:hypothetical protein